MTVSGIARACGAAVEERSHPARHCGRPSGHTNLAKMAPKLDAGGGWDLGPNGPAFFFSLSFYCFFSV